MSNFIELHCDSITITFSSAVRKLIRAEIERQRREYSHKEPQTPLELAEEMVRFHCEAMASKWIEVRR